MRKENVLSVTSNLVSISEEASDTSAAEPKQYARLTEIPLHLPENVRAILSAWYFLQELKESHTGALIVSIEMERRYYSANLTNKHRTAIRWNLIEDRTQQEVGRIMKTSPRKVVQYVQEGIERICEFGALNDSEVAS